MRYLALACDYDGTLAANGRVDRAVISALEELVASGRKLILLTGRDLDDLRQIFPEIEIFDSVVCEDGALLFHPPLRAVRRLAPLANGRLVDALRLRGVAPLRVGECIVATRQPNEEIVAQTIGDLHLELQVNFNKGALMILPAGVNKATGLEAALKELGLSSRNLVGIGDAENDYQFLARCRCSVAVANALPALKDYATFTTKGSAGDGVVELVQEILADDLAGRENLASQR